MAQFPRCLDISLKDQWNGLNVQTLLNRCTGPCKTIQPTISTPFRQVGGAIRQSGRTVRCVSTFIRGPSAWDLIHNFFNDMTSLCDCDVNYKKMQTNTSVITMSPSCPINVPPAACDFTIYLAWIPASFKVISRSNGYISGTMKSEEELGFLLENHKRATYTSFNTWSEHKKDKIKRRLLWQVEDYADDVPVCVEKRAILACQHGKASKRHSTAEEQPSEHIFSKKRLYVQSGKKVDCPAKLFIRHVTRYDTFSVKGDASRAKKQEAMKRLKEALTQTSPATSSFIHVKLPVAEAHQNHIINEASFFKRKIHPQENMGQDRDSRQQEENMGQDRDSRQQEENMGQDRDTRQQEENMGQDRDTRQQEENMGQDRVRENHITVEQCALRDELNKIMDATYLCQDIETLQKTKEAVADIRKSFIGSCPKGNGLPLLSKENQLMRENNQMLQALPPRVRKGKLEGQFEIYWGGVGVPK